MAYNYEMDKRFMDFYNGRLHQVFIYITDRCQLRCKQCLMKPNLEFQIGNHEIPLKDAVDLLSDFRQLGASKLTILGGEPILYGNNLFELIKKTKTLGYEYVRMDTNGQFNPSVLENEDLSSLNEISFSLDGYNEDLHEYCRGKGTFPRLIQSIKKAVELNYNVGVTLCVHTKMAEKDSAGNYVHIENTIKLAEELGIKALNFHVLLNHGMPINTWSKGTEISNEDRMAIYETLKENVANGKYNIELRLPQHFITKEEFDKKPDYYGYCAIKLGERVLVTPDGQIRTCAGMLSSKYAAANFFDRKIIRQEGLANEGNDIDFDCATECAYQFKHCNTGENVPLCFSFKPDQKEFVWNNKLNLK